jgi:hypothetical protein
MELSAGLGYTTVLAAARTLWFIAHIDRGTGMPLGRYRPWYRQKVAPSQLDGAEACREALREAGIFPIPRFIRCSPVSTLKIAKGQSPG